MIEEEIALRWTEERARLGFSQSDMARKLGVTRQTMGKYENALTIVSSEALAKAAHFGFDVQYILVGKRSADFSGGAENHTHISEVSGGVGVQNNSPGGKIINTQKHVTKTNVEVRPGAVHISDKQAQILKSLVDEVVRLEKTLKKKPASYASVWGSLNSHCSVTSYRLILAGDFERAKKYLDQWIGRINSMATAPIKDGDNWRRRRYAYIKINSKHPDEKITLDAYVKRRFNTIKLSELANDELEQVYRYVAGKKNKAVTRK